MPQNIFSVQREKIWNMISIRMGEGIFRFNERQMGLTLARWRERLSIREG